jgi:hypothetical protein
MPALSELRVSSTHPAGDENLDEPGHERRNYTTLPLFTTDIDVASLAWVFLFEIAFMQFEEDIDIKCHQTAVFACPQSRLVTHCTAERRGCMFVLKRFGECLYENFESCQESLTVHFGRGTYFLPMSSS